MGPKKFFNLKRDEGLRRIFQLNQRAQYLNIYLETSKPRKKNQKDSDESEEDEAPVISLQQLKKAKEEVEDFKRFIKFGDYRVDWLEYID